MLGKRGRALRVHKISGSRWRCQGSQRRGLGGLVGTTEIRKYQILFLTCDHEVLVLLVDIKVKRVTHVISVDEDKKVGIVYHGLGLAHNEHRHLKVAPGDYPAQSHQLHSR